MRRPPVLTGDDTAAYLHDAARTPGGYTPEVYLPRDEGEVAWVLRSCPAVLPVGAQSSLTGGATPLGETLLSTARLDALGVLRAEAIWCGAGVALTTLAERLAASGRFFPPAPTFDGAFVGGVASTNAAGAATFKYGVTRDWVAGLTVVLASGDVLDVRRGECRAGSEGFEIAGTDGRSVRVAIPTYVLPDVPKRSAGYYAAPGMDLADLFVGSEGTLGVIVDVELRVAAAPPRALVWALFPDEGRALAAVGSLRDAAHRTWRERDPEGADIAAIESLDRRSLRVLSEDDVDREQGAPLPPDADTALLVQVELQPGTDRAGAMDQVAALEGGAGSGPLTRALDILRRAGALDAVELALPGDRRRARQLLALREGVPVGVNHRIEAVQRESDPDVHKTAADMVVPFEHLAEMVGLYREAFVRRRLDHALWGHVSDGNLHANVLPRSRRDVASGEEAFLELAEHALRLGGCPMSEHGVGRNPVKQFLLRRLVGDEGIAQMRAVKRALDPRGVLAPGVLFPAREAGGGAGVT